ncbi:MAG: AAA family ATPase, partial [Desulfovibrio sp.]|nr:AAA family ATPase [Desulfovibrio sp.]
MSTGFIDLPYENALTELLGVHKEIEALSAFILDCQTPMTIAIQGDWGTGKTSMMKMIQSNISDKCDCVWFNTWQFSQFQMQDEVPLALLAQLVEQVVGDKSKVSEFISSLGRKLKDATGVVVEASAGIPSVGKALDSLLFKQRVVEQTAQLKQLKERLNTVIDEKLKKDKKSRLVIFVDDLDRMSPGKAVELLEVVKIFLDIPGCVFVLAVDYGVVSRGVKAKYGEDMDELKGRSFFDKIIQLPFNLPVARYTIEKYLQNLLDIPDNYVRSYTKLAKASVGTNPRTLKRMANILKLLEIIETREKNSQPITEEYRELLFAALCLQIAFETVYAQLLSEGVKNNLLEAKPDEILSMFSGALTRAPENKEELQKKLARFFKTLNEVLSDMGDNGWQEFTDVLRKSGITASGSQQPIMTTEAINDSFDPALLGSYANLPGELSEKYKDYFAALKLTPEIDPDEPNNLSIPAIFAWPVSFSVELEPEGINVFFWSEEYASIRNCFRRCLKETSVELPSQMKSSKGYAFMSLPTIPWEVSLSQQDKSASAARLEQTREIIFKWCDALLRPLTKLYSSKAKVVDRLEDLIDKIEEIFRASLPEEKGWRCKRESFGAALYAGWTSLSFWKSGWKEQYKVELITDSLFANDMNIGISQAKNKNFENDSKLAKFYNAWRKALINLPGMNEEDMIGKSEEYCAWAVFPEGLGDWTEGELHDADFSFALNE